MRRIMIAAVAAAIGTTLAACGSTSYGGSSAAPASPVDICPKASIGKLLYQPGVLTVGTDKPVYPPWFSGNNPSNGKGYESAVAYAVAKQLGFSSSQVRWVYEPFNNSYAPGPKKFDFDINEISATPKRAQAVWFSASYYDVQQALVALAGTPIVTQHQPGQLKHYVYGDQIGKTSLAFINSGIQPKKQPKAQHTPNDVQHTHP